MKYKKINKYLIFIISVLLLNINVFAEECGLDGMSTSSDTDTTNCSNHFYCCVDKVYNTCGWDNETPPDGLSCRVITGLEIEQYQNDGICPCGCSDDNACYLDFKNNIYYWGKYADNTRYRKVSGISDEASCNNFCWKSTDSGENQYSEGINPPTTGNWTKVGKVGSVTCSETPACYKKGNEYKWGNYSEISGYTKVDGVTDENDCKAPVNYCWKKTDASGNTYQESPTSPGNEWQKIDKDNCSETPACYEKDDNYVVGKYNGINGYNKISNNVNTCNKLVIKKVDSNGNEISGAEITITKPDKSKETKTIGNVVVKELSEGTYTIEETKAPSGYQSNDTKITFTVASDGKITINNASNIYSKSTTSTLNANVSIKNSLLDSVCWTRTTKDGNEYQESPTSPGDDWKKVDKENCHEEAFCYDNGTDYVWGNYENVTGYTKIAGINEESKCVKPKPFCYKHKETGKYTWGLFQDNSSYELVPNTNQSDCHEDVPNVPKTALNTSMILLIATLVLSSVGIGLLIYTKHMKSVE